MDINVTYHWTHLEYTPPIWKHHDTWGPVATIKIMAKMETPFLNEKTVWGTYGVFEYVVNGHGGDPQDQIIKAVQHYANEHGIEIQFDFLERWNRKSSNSMEATWDYEF